MRISVIVPVLNEAEILRDFLLHLRERFPSCEIIAVDGGSNDGSAEIAPPHVDQTVQSNRGRATQMNAGAKLATGDVFWFLHADSIIASSAAAAIEKALADAKTVGGCFRLKIDSTRWIYRFRDALGNLLVDLTGVALGDRGIFCRRETFFRVGGYPEISILEDAELYRAIKKQGCVIQVNEIIRTSARRYEALGPATTMIFYALIMFFYAARVPIRLLEQMVASYMKHRTAI